MPVKVQTIYRKKVPNLPQNRVKSYRTGNFQHISPNTLLNRANPPMAVSLYKLGKS